MQVEILFYGVFRDVVGEKRLRREIAPDDTVRELVEALTDEFPELKDHLITSDGDIDESVNVTVNGRAIGFLDDGNTLVEEGDLIRFAHSLSGG